MKVISFSLAFGITTVGAFAPPSLLSSPKSCSKTCIIINNKQVNGNPLFMSSQQEQPLVQQIQDKAQEWMTKLSDVDMGGLTSNMDSIKDNLMEGQVGSRGEVYALAQGAILLCILLGGIPFVGNALMILLGPVMLIAGAIVILLSTNDLGASLSPWPVPATKGTLKTQGLYAEMRHPTYAGLLAACAGLSIITGSATRLLLTALLLYSLNIKADYEEKELLKKYPEYATYQATVTSKFFPESILEQLPWMKKGDESKGELPWMINND